MFKMTFSQIFTSVDKDLARFGKTDKYFARELDLKDIKVPVKIRDVHKVEIKNMSASVFLAMRIKKNSQSNLKFKKYF